MYENLKNTSLFFLEEPILPYFAKAKIDVNNIGALTFKELLNDKFSLVAFIKQGVPYLLFNKIQDLLPFDEEEWAGYLGISSKTLHRNKLAIDFYFKPILSEKIIEMAEIGIFGIQVFEDKSNFHKWLRQKNRSLGNLKPMDIIANSYGKDLVIDCLNKIEYGIFA